MKCVHIRRCPYFLEDCIGVKYLGFPQKAWKRKKKKERREGKQDNQRGKKKKTSSIWFSNYWKCDDEYMRVHLFFSLLYTFGKSIKVKKNIQKTSSLKMETINLIEITDQVNYPLNMPNLIILRVNQWYTIHKNSQRDFTSVKHIKLMIYVPFDVPL